MIIGILTVMMFASNLGQSLAGTSDDPEIHSAIKQLVSNDEAARHQGATRLLRRGPAAVEPLLALLRETITYPESVVGNPEEGIARIDVEGSHWVIRMEPEQASRGNELRSKSGESIKRAVEDLGRLKARVRDDVLRILRLLGAEDEAISVLANDLRALDPSFDAGIVIRPSMHGLTSIGPRAAPKVLEVFRTAEELPESAMGKESSSRGGDHPPFGFNPNLIRSRAAFVLGEIGDSDVLPALSQELRTLADQQSLDLRTARYIEDAIKRITKRGSSR